MRIEDLTDQDGNIIEEGLTTSIRGKSILLTADLLNTLLGVENAPSRPFREFTDVEIFSLLKPGEPLGPLSFSPGSMKDELRLVWYVYSRSLVNKGKKFSHFTGKDYSLMASIVSQEPRNLGQWILDEMKQFRFHSSVTSTIPFPSLISYVLFLHNVWYLVAGEKPVALERFGQVHFSTMKISFKEATTIKSKPKKESRMEPHSSPTKTDEAQSSQAGSPSSAPSFFKASIQAQLQEAVQSAMHSSHESLLQKIDISQELFLHRIQQFQEDLVKKIDSQIKKVVEGLNHNFTYLSDTLQGQVARLDKLELPLSSHLNLSTSSDPSPPTSVTPPTSVPSDPIPTSPILPTESGSLHPEPTFTPHHHSTSSSSDTSSPTFDPMSALIIYSPPSSTFTFPTLFPDDKREKSS